MQALSRQWRPAARAWLTVAGLCLAIGCGMAIPSPVEHAEVPEEVDFNLHVKPILSDRCYPCHGPDANTRQAELRLDTERGLFSQLQLKGRGRPVVPGRPERSEIIRRLVSGDPEYRMPPPEANLAVSDQEIATILAWIRQGAAYKPHWSRIPAAAPALPAVADVSWPRDTLDHFILARMEHAGVAPWKEASKETLIRRVSFDLTGLPPTLDEVDAFLADSGPQAYERVVDRLLASPAYGERMATEWLDVARYADSHGYQDDGLRNMWPWRDWVIDAFNRNIPFDDFVTWQLAGDLLPEPTDEQILATGFNRNHLQSQEGGIVPEEYRVDYVADRTETFGKAFLGLTVRCARCHDHKFDPLSQKEYYELYSFFNNVNEFGNIPYAGEASPTLILVDSTAEHSLAALAARARDLEALTETAHERFGAAFRDWLGEGGTLPEHPPGLIAHYPLDEIRDRTFANASDPGRPALLRGDADKITRTVPGRFGTAQVLVGDPFIDMGGEIGYFERNEPFSVSLWFRILEAGVEGPLFNKAGGLFNGKRGYVGMIRKDGTLSASLNHVFPANSIEIVSSEPLPVGSWHHLAMTYDGSSRARGLVLYLDGARLPSETRVDNLKKSILYTVDPRSGERTNWGDPGNFRLGWMETNFVKLDSVAVDEVRLFDRRLSKAEVAGLSGQGVSSEAALRDYYVTAIDPDYRRDFAELTRLRGEINTLMTALPEVMVMEELAERRPTHVLDRGAYDAPLEPVGPGTPAALLPFPDEYPENRLGLAQWLFDERNPRTARVAVNRYWQMYFGRGLVETAEDFGNQGALPSHPLLLDYLATWFRASGWDLRALQRKIVLSATYRQRSGAGTSEFYAGAPSYRMSAEMIRDNALATSGLLVRTVGGPPVKPYQPPGLWKELATRNATEYVRDSGESLYRRSLYTIWKRTTPPPAMMNFDASERNVCTVRRQATSTPLQALVLLNDPQHVEAARMLAERMAKEAGPETLDRLTFAFRLLTSRRPEAGELDPLVTLYMAEKKAFAEDPAAALALLRTGDYVRDETLEAPEVAALTVVANTIMNFDEAIMRR